jgi:hypothetical protein
MPAQKKRTRAITHTDSSPASITVIAAAAITTTTISTTTISTAAAAISAQDRHGEN